MSAEKNENETVRETTGEASTPDAAAECAKAAGKDWQAELKKFAFAAIGAANLSPEDVKSFVKRLVEKGELAKKDGEKILKDVAERVQKTVKRDGKPVVERVEESAQEVAEKATASQEKLAERINASIERMLHTMNIATRKDLADLGRQLDELDRKVEQLVAAAAAGSAGRASRKAPAAHASGSGAA